MANKEAKDWLNAVRDADKRINEKLERYERMKAKCYSVTIQPKEVNVQSSTAGTLENKILNLDAYGKRINQKIDELVGMKLERQIVIDKMQDNTLARLLEYRYIDCWEWDAVAHAMNYTEAYTRCRLHGRALAEFTKMHHNAS